ncbi:MAG: hypothetical protein PHZ00_06170 [Candidatus Peribacteraceae bacterium]|nr:hypothetical protein [Candidatus Peribacteraceae bacterium]
MLWSVRLSVLFRLGAVFLLVCAVNLSVVFADTQRTDDYIMPADAIVPAGEERGSSVNFMLVDTIGEPAIGPGESAEYMLDSGYRQLASDPFIGMNCSASVALPSIAVFGASTASGTCIAVTDADAGYSLSWGVFTGSGGTNTGSLIASAGNTIGPYTPAAGGVPETWSVPSNAAEWGGRLKSVSTDTDVKWGTEGGGEKWLNIPALTSGHLVSRSGRTDIAGSTEILQFRAEIGSGILQTSGTYEAVVTFTLVSL